MKTEWRPARLGDVLNLVRRSETIQPVKTYDLMGARLDGAGPFLRETKTGDQISANQLFRVAAGDFIYSRLFAWRGAFGTIGQRLNGKYVSDEFPTFVADPDRLDVEFLQLWFRLPSTLRTVESLCSGSTPLTRNRFKEQFFLELEIPLPPLAEQQRIVARIDALAAHTEEAKGLRAQAVAEVEAVAGIAKASVFAHEASSDWSRTSLGEITEIVSGATLGRKLEGPTTHLPYLRVANVQDGFLIWRTSSASRSVKANTASGN